MPSETAEITYHNKDVAAKYFMESLREKSLKPLGIDLPKVKDVFSISLPVIKATELRLDEFLVLEDDSLAILDYESDYSRKKMKKYLNYVTAIVNKYPSMTDGKRKIRMIVIYTADVEKADKTLDLGCLKMTIEQGFLLKMDTEKIFERLKEKIAAKELLTDEELMEAVVLPLTVKGNQAKVKLLGEALEMAKNIEDEEQLKFVLLGMIVFADKITDKNTARKIKEMISMTKVGRLFIEDMEEQIRIERERAEAERQKIEAEKERAEEALKKKTEEDKAKLLSLAIKLMNEGMSAEKIMDILNITPDMLK